MTDGGLIRELLDYSDWARERLLATALPLADAALDQPFEMGPGSIRRTMLHIAEADKVWLERWEGVAQPSFNDDPAGRPLADIAAHWRSVNQRRRTFLEGALAAGRLSEAVSYKNLKGQEYRQPVGELALHTFNHGMHHRSQISNMLRHVGAPLPKPGTDYIFYKRELGRGPAVAPAVAPLREYFAYGDWATDRLLETMKSIPESSWARRFDMGVEMLPQTLLHILHAEEWWHANALRGPGAAFPSDRDFGSIEAYRRRRDQHRTARDAYFATLSDADMGTRVVIGESTTGKRFEFPICVIMLQLCLHGTHHRAQALNMIRHLGGKPPALDYVARMRELEGSA